MGIFGGLKNPLEQMQPMQRPSPLGADINPLQQPVEGPTNVGKKRGGIFGGLFGGALGGAMGGNVPMFGAAGQALGINPKLAALSQIFSSLGGGQSPIFGLMLQQQQQQRAEQLAQQNREAEFADFQRKQQWMRDNAKPVINDTINDFNWYKGLDPADRALYQEMRPRFMTGPDGLPYAASSQPSAQAPQVIGADLPDGWEMEGGAGGPPAGNGFRYP